MSLTQHPNFCDMRRPETATSLILTTRAISIQTDSKIFFEDPKLVATATYLPPMADDSVVDMLRTDRWEVCSAIAGHPQNQSQLL